MGDVDANQLLLETLKMNQTLLRTSIELQVRILARLEGKTTLEFQKELEQIVGIHKQATQHEINGLFDFLTSKNNG